MSAGGKTKEEERLGSFLLPNRRPPTPSVLMLMLYFGQSLRGLRALAGSWYIDEDDDLGSLSICFGPFGSILGHCCGMQRMVVGALEIPIWDHHSLSVEEQWCRKRLTLWDDEPRAVGDKGMLHSMCPSRNSQTPPLLCWNETTSLGILLGSLVVKNLWLLCGAWQKN